MDLDERDRKIIHHIIRYPDQTNEQIATNTDIPHSTINKRIAYLTSAEGCLERPLRVRDWASAGFPKRVRIDILVHQRNLAKGKGGPIKLEDDDGSEGDADDPSPFPLPPARIRTQKQLARYIKDRLPLHSLFAGKIIIERVAILLGQQADISLQVHARDEATVLAFVTQGLRSLDGVQSTSTSQESWVY